LDIQNKDNYFNVIYQGYIINDSKSDDPEGQSRYQIYVPQLHYDILEANVEKYGKLSAEDKINDELFGYFPWATTLVGDLEQGDVIYGSFLKNSNNSFIILGTLPKDDEGEGGAGDINGDDIVELAMPIIIENEVGVSRNNWPDKISDADYGNIASNDNGAWSIGLIQWHGCRAFDILYHIAEEDSNWKSNWDDKSLTIVSDISSALKAKTAVNYRNKWNVTVYNSKILQGARNMLISSKGKEVQKDYARKATKTAFDILIDSPYNISNPGILIFCMDIMNQYGNGVNGVSSVKGCLTEAAKISKNDKGIIEQLSQFREWWKNKSSYTKNGKLIVPYETRRKTTYDYIVQLEKQGKLSSLSVTDLTCLAGLKHVPEYGEYFWPVPSSDHISCFWGEGKKPLTYNFKYNSDRNYQGYNGWNRPHKGTDITGKSGCEVIAVGAGTVAYVYGNGVIGGGASQGNCIGIRMDKNPDHHFVYMHLCKPPKFKVGDRVKPGDVVGYMGTTGNSTGTHLHIGLHLKAVWPSPQNLTTMIDPLPYFGKKVKGVSIASSTKKSSGKVTGDDIINYAKNFLGCKYVWGAEGPNTFDCSGLTYYVYKHFGYTLNRVSADQRKNGVSVSKNNLQKGDLVHFTGHVALYYGDNKILHASNSNGKVVVSSLSENWYVKNYWGARRIL